MLLVGNVRMILTMSSTLVASLIQGFQVLSSPGRIVGNVALLWKGWIASLLTLYGYLSFHALVKHFSRTHSDHYPLILNTDPENHSNPKPFRLESMWVKHSSFDNLVYSHQPSNSPNYLASLKNLTNAIIIWNKRIFDNFLIRKNKSQQDWKVSKLSSKVNTILTSHLLKKSYKMILMVFFLKRSNTGQ